MSAALHNSQPPEASLMAPETSCPSHADRHIAGGADEGVGLLSCLPAHDVRLLLPPYETVNRLASLRASKI